MFCRYNPNKSCLEGNEDAPKFCKDTFSNPAKKCKNYYQDLQKNGKKETVYTCPYGFSSCKVNDQIYTSLLISSHFDYSKVTTHLKDNKQRLSEFTVFTEKDFVKISASYQKMKRDFDNFSYTLHDLKNASTHLIDLSENIKSNTNLTSILSQNEDLYSAVEGYSLIGYLLKYHDQRVGFLPSPVIKTCKPHKILMKLSKLLKFRASKRDIVINLVGRNDLEFELFDDVYLGYFILIENAIKYCPNNSIISIDVKDFEDKYTKITISNITEAIRDDELQFLSTLGYRSEVAQATTQGHGLGLNLAKKIFTNSRITLDFHMNMVNKKSVFSAETIILK